MARTDATPAPDLTADEVAAHFEAAIVAAADVPNTPLVTDDVRHLSILGAGVEASTVGYDDCTELHLSILLPLRSQDIAHRQALTSLGARVINATAMHATHNLRAVEYGVTHETGDAVRSDDLSPAAYGPHGALIIRTRLYVR